MNAGLLRRLDDVLGRGEDLFLAVSHGIIAVLVIAAVFFRYVLSDPLTWTEEFIVIVFTWMLFVGLSSGFRHQMHIRIDVLLMALGRSGRLVVGVLAVAATLVTLVALTWFGTEQAFIMATTQTPMMRISAGWAVSALPVGTALSCVHILRHVICDGPDQALWPEDLVGAAEGEV
jgi:TRAP-type C4-dicarboxylate transport system permease small subunit